MGSRPSLEKTEISAEAMRFVAIFRLVWAFATGLADRVAKKSCFDLDIPFAIS
jgi:hypothetical protein